VQSSGQLAETISCLQEDACNLPQMGGSRWPLQSLSVVVVVVVNVVVKVEVVVEAEVVSTHVPHSAGQNADMRLAPIEPEQSFFCNSLHEALSGSPLQCVFLGSAVVVTELHVLHFTGQRTFFHTLLTVEQSRSMQPSASRFPSQYARM